MMITSTNGRVIKQDIHRKRKKRSELIDLKRKRKFT